MTMVDGVSVRLLFVFVLSLVASLSSQISADEAEGKEFVLTLDHSNFSNTVSIHDFIIVEFYAPWCGHCKKLVPENEKATSILSSHDPPVVLAKVDANEEQNRESSPSATLVASRMERTETETEDHKNGRTEHGKRESRDSTSFGCSHCIAAEREEREKWRDLLTLLCCSLPSMGYKTLGFAERMNVKNRGFIWAFDHIKYFNGGSEIQLHLDK